MKCALCGVKLSDKNYAKSFGFSGYCAKCERQLAKVG